jgi:arylsulfatase A-like enzyme
MQLGLLVLPLLTAWVSCGDRREPVEPRLPVAEPNVVLIVIDTLRADRLPFYGGPDTTAPYLASLASQGLVYDNAWAASSWTAPATASIFTGLHPDQHGVAFNAFSQMRQRKALGVFVDNRLREEIETLPVLLKRHGYRTFGVSDNPNVDRRLGFDRGFDRFAGRKELGGSGAVRVSDQVHAWQAEILASDKYFLYLHFADPHTPYHRHAEWIDPEAEMPEDPSLDLAAYDSEIRYADEHIRIVLESLGLGPETLVIVTSDHGQEFLDHGGRGHGFKLYSELTRVPLLIYQAGNRTLAGRVAEHVAHVDLLPTLRDLLGEPIEAGRPGRPLLGGVGESTSTEPGVHAMRWGILGTRVLQLRSLVRGRYKLILTEPLGGVELYDLVDDPRERHDLSTQRPDVVAALRSEIDAQRAEQRPPSEQGAGAESSAEALSPELLRELEALGYGEDGLNEGVPSEREQVPLAPAAGQP